MAAFSYIPSSFLSFSNDRKATQCWLRRSLPLPAAVVCRATPGKRRRRSNRRKMSDEDLRNGLKEFISSIGLPDGHVPSTNELTKHGRKDLANMVRRRGYDEIEVLLSDSFHVAGQDKKVKDLNEEFLDLTHEVSSTRNPSEVSEPDVCLDGKSLITSSSPLQDKVERFISYGHLDTVEEDSSYQRAPQGTMTGSDEYKVINGTVVSSRDLSAEVPEDTSFDKDNEDEDEVRNQVEVERLSLLLQQKELELSRLKRDIEMEKQALSSLQSKAEIEINKAQVLISEKEAELLAAEESLSGLKEITIQYAGEGETVEVSGSFNGWHQPIKMEPQVSHTGSDSTGSRKPEVWTITMWLYPGEYEIKFVVDGKWKIDPAREITRRGGLENNILRVEK